MSRHVALRHRGRLLEGTLELHGGHARLRLEGREVEAVVRREGSVAEVVRGDATTRLRMAAAPHGVWIAHEGRTYYLETPRADGGPGPAETAENEVHAPMTARVVSVAAVPGARVREGDLLVTLEAMKMEFRLAAPFDGGIDEVLCGVGDRVDVGQLLVRMAPPEGAGPPAGDGDAS